MIGLRRCFVVSWVADGSFPRRTDQTSERASEQTRNEKSEKGISGGEKRILPTHHPSLCPLFLALALGFVSLTCAYMETPATQAIFLSVTS